jgi:hypothetical protein
MTKKSSTDPMLKWLPELYGPAGPKKKPDGMCTPGSDCGPSAGKPAKDLLELLKEAGLADADRPSEGNGKEEED